MRHWRLLTTTLGRAALTSQRLLPVVAPLRTLLPGGGLRRGRAVTVRGAAALSLAMALVAEAHGRVRGPSWLAHRPDRQPGDQRSHRLSRWCTGRGGRRRRRRWCTGRSAGVGGVGGGPGLPEAGRAGLSMAVRVAALVGLPRSVLEAVAGLGVALERVVRVAVALGLRYTGWRQAGGAPMGRGDGCDPRRLRFVITAVPPSAVHVAGAATAGPARGRRHRRR